MLPHAGRISPNQALSYGTRPALGCRMPSLIQSAIHVPYLRRTEMKIPLGIVVLLGYAIGFSALSKSAHADGWNGHAMAFTFSSDDGNLEPNLQWGKVFNDRGLSYTAFIVSDWVNNSGFPGKLQATDLQTLHVQGIEIASHGKTHHSLVEISTPDSVIDELVLSATALETFISDPNYRCRTFAYPLHEHNPREMALASLVGYTAARDGGQDDSLTWPYVSEGKATWSKTDLFELPLAVTVDILVGPPDNFFSRDTVIARVQALLAAYEPDSNWINIYAHNLQDIDSTRLGWVIDEVRQGDVWIDNVVTIADYYREMHGLPVPSRVQRPVGGTPSESEVLPFRAAPNPSRSFTTLSFTLQTPEPVHLEIIGIDGRHVATLISGERRSGPQTVTWRGKDDLGVSVASGVYLARLQTRTLQHSQRLILLP
jgi:Predicted xylanase/chitin deacetylase